MATGVEVRAHRIRQPGMARSLRYADLNEEEAGPRVKPGETSEDPASELQQRALRRFVEELIFANADGMHALKQSIVGLSLAVGMILALMTVFAMVIAPFCTGIMQKRTPTSSSVYAYLFRPKRFLSCAKNL